MSDDLTETISKARAASLLIKPICDACQREVDRVRGSMWHGDSRATTALEELLRKQGVENWEN